MRRLLVLVAAVGTLTLASCFHGAISPVVTVEAQTLPATRTLSWDQTDLVTAAVTGFTVQMDAQTPILIGTMSCGASAPYTCSQSVIFTSLGSHTLSVIATNTWGNSIPATLTVNVTSPGKSGNLKIS